MNISRGMNLRTAEVTPPSGDPFKHLQGLAKEGKDWNAKNKTTETTHAGKSVSNLGGKPTHT